MKIADNTAAEIGIALNEATLLGAEYEAQRNLVGLTFSVLTLLDNDSPEPADARRQFILTDVGRIAAALRDAKWNDTMRTLSHFRHQNYLRLFSHSVGNRSMDGNSSTTKTMRSMNGKTDCLSISKWIPDH